MHTGFSNNIDNLGGSLLFNTTNDLKDNKASAFSNPVSSYMD